MDSLGNINSGDDSLWEGLACPPIDDFAFNFDCEDFKFDDILNDPLLLEYDKDGKLQESAVNCSKTADCYAKEDEEEFNKIIAHECLTNPLAASVEEVHHSKHKTPVKSNVLHQYGNNGKGKELRTVIQVLKLTKEEIDGLLGVNAKEKQGLIKTSLLKKPPSMLNNAIRADHQDKHDRKRKTCYDSQSMQQATKNSNQVGNYKGKADYESRMEVTRRKLHESYERIAEAKQQRSIQLIEFQKPHVELPKSNTKSSTRKRLNQKIMNMKAHKTYKKLRPVVY